MENPAPSTQAVPVQTGIVPALALSDAQAALDFYVKAFDAKVLSRIPVADGRLIHSLSRINNADLIINDAFPEHGYPVQTPQAFVLHLQVDDVDFWWNRAIAAGATIAMPLERQFWGDRYGQLRDPFGVTWSLATSDK